MTLTVVGAAILRDGCVLAARRTAPAAAAGRWEFPGGKVEPGETREAALVREVAEELGCRVEVTGWLAGEVPISETHTLAVALANLVDGAPEPVEHDLVRWLAAGELSDVDWLEADRPFLAELRDLLTTLTP
ncbi:MAG TPA: NUDIX domain-containing protein [Nocardioides sp.]|nr:NUDIX domain-containing protein [Nocardioides sp.]